MATLNLHNIGDLVRVTGTLATAGGARVDPATVTVKVRAPSGTVTTHRYNQDPFPLRVEAGVYYVDVTPNAAGEWYYRFESTGTGQAADEGKFVVAESQFS